MQVLVVVAIYRLRSTAQQGHGDVVRPRRRAARHSVAENEHRDPSVGKSVHFKISWRLGKRNAAFALAWGCTTVAEELSGVAHLDEELGVGPEPTQLFIGQQGSVGLPRLPDHRFFAPFRITGYFIDGSKSLE